MRGRFSESQRQESPGLEFLAFVLCMVPVVVGARHPGSRRVCLWVTLLFWQGNWIVGDLFLGPLLVFCRRAKADATFVLVTQLWSTLIGSRSSGCRSSGQVGSVGNRLGLGPWSQPEPQLWVERHLRLGLPFCGLAMGLASTSTQAFPKRLDETPGWVWV